MKLRFPSLLTVLLLLPSIWREVIEEVTAARAADSDGGATITRVELEALAANIALRLGEKLTALLFAANGIHLDADK